MLGDGVNTFAWNARNQVATLNNVSLKYDAFGRRIQNAAGTSFLYDGVNTAQELSGSTVTANLLSGGIDEVFTRSDSSGAFTKLKDALGSTFALVDSSGNVQTAYTYDPFGNTSVTGTSNGNEFQYTGRESEGNGLYFYRARYYSPLLGRFISEDPLGFAGSGPNYYAYAGNSPTNFVDPSGLSISCWLSPWICDDAGNSASNNSTRGDTFKKKKKGEVGNRMSAAQCQAAYVVLQREEQDGTTEAAWESAIGFGDGTVEPFNSSNPNNAYVETAAGTVKVDWFTDLRLSGLIPGLQVGAYIVGKGTWTLERDLMGAPIANPYPFEDPVETHTLNLAIAGYGFRNLFTPEFMRKNCESI